MDTDSKAFWQKLTWVTGFMFFILTSVVIYIFNAKSGSIVNSTMQVEGVPYRDFLGSMFAIADAGDFCAFVIALIKAIKTN